MKKGLLILFTIITSLALSQRICIKVNGVNYLNKTVCNPAPIVVEYAFTDTSVKVFKGVFTLARGKHIIKKVSIDTSMNYVEDVQMLFSYLQPDDKLLLDVEEVFIDNKIKKVSLFSLVRFGQLIPSLNPNGDILVNNSVLYRATGIMKDSIRTIVYTSTVPMDSIYFFVIHERGQRLVSTRCFENLQNGVFNTVFFEQGLSGDSFIFQIMEGEYAKDAGEDGMGICDKTPKQIITIPII